MVDVLGRCLRNKRGQSILEYLVITTVVVAAILAIRATVKTNMNSVFGKAAERVGDSQKVLNNFVVQAN